MIIRPYGCPLFKGLLHPALCDMVEGPHER